MNCAVPDGRRLAGVVDDVRVEARLVGLAASGGLLSLQSRTLGATLGFLLGYRADFHARLRSIRHIDFGLGRDFRGLAGQAAIAERNAADHDHGDDNQRDFADAVAEHGVEVALHLVRLAALRRRFRLGLGFTLTALPLLLVYAFCLEASAAHDFIAGLRVLRGVLLAHVLPLYSMNTVTA